MEISLSFLAFLLLLNFAYSKDGIRQINGKWDSSQTYYVGDTVYHNASDEFAKGPYELISINEDNTGIIRIPGTSITYHVFLTTDIAVKRGCGKKSNICISNLVYDSIRPGLYKVMAKYESTTDDHFVTALCLNSSCSITTHDNNPRFFYHQNGTELSLP